MMEEVPASPANPPAPDAASAPPSAAPAKEGLPPAAPQIPFHIGEEFGTARKNLPPAKIVLITVAAIAVLGAIVAFVFRPKSSATGSIDDVVAVEIPDQNSVMVAINFTIQNHGKGSFKIHHVKADLDASIGQFSDEPAAAVDFQRYFQALPALKAHALEPFNIEKQLPPGGETKATIIVSFPVTIEAFNSRKSLTVTIEPYGETVPLVLAK